MQLAANNMKVSVYRLMVDPEFYLYNYANNDNSSEFLIVEEAQLEAAPFIDNRFERFARGQFRVPWNQLAEFDRHFPGLRPRQYYIFHHAFVCSTLLARCLAQSGSFFTLKEPYILRRLSDIKHYGHSPYVYSGITGRTDPGANGNGSSAQSQAGTAWSELVRTNLRLLAKQYSRGDSVVIKASNVANNLIPELLHLTSGRILYLFGGLEGFIVSNLKKAAETQQKVPELLERISSYGSLARQHPEYLAAARGNFYRECAMLWLVSNEHFLEQAESCEGDRCRTLSAEHFLSTREDNLERVCSWFDHPASPTELQAMTSDDIFGRHAKDPNQPFGDAQRMTEKRQILDRHGKEIAAAQRWIEPLVENLGTRDRLAHFSLR